MLDNAQSFNIKGNRNWKKFAKGPSRITWHASWLGVFYGLFDPLVKWENSQPLSFLRLWQDWEQRAKPQSSILHSPPNPAVSSCTSQGDFVFAEFVVGLMKGWSYDTESRQTKPPCWLSREMKMETIAYGNQFMCSESCDRCVVPINKHSSTHVHTRYKAHLVSHPRALSPWFPLKKWSL